MALQAEALVIQSPNRLAVQRHTLVKAFQKLGPESKMVRRRLATGQRISGSGSIECFVIILCATYPKLERFDCAHYWTTMRAKKLISTQTIIYVFRSARNRVLAFTSDLPRMFSPQASVVPSAYMFLAMPSLKPMPQTLSRVLAS